jgi:transposase InsO family protein
MDRYGLVSSYTVKAYRVHKTTCNEAKIDNVLNRNFNDNKEHQAVVSDLTYVNVNNKWNYVCILIDLFNREIIGYSSGKNKDAILVTKAFSNVKTNLNNSSLFHTDCGNEFKNKIIYDILNVFNIRRSLSHKGCPYDNAVAEATFKIFKTEFVKRIKYDSSENLQLELSDYINWYNNFRIHGSLGYQSPIEYKKSVLIKTV